MKTAEKPSPFDQSALDHFLDFERDRKVSLEIVPPEMPLDGPTLKMTIPISGAGDQRGLEALGRHFMAGEMIEIGVRFQEKVYPCMIRCVSGFGEPEAVLSLRVIGSPE
jgi:hypothetical protein